MKITDLTGNVTRRNFLSGTAGAISGAALLPTDHAVEGLNKSISLEQMAHALHEAVGRYSDQNTSYHFGPCPLDDKHPLIYSMERLRDCSVDDIQHLLKPLYENRDSQFSSNSPYKSCSHTGRGLSSI